MSKCMIFIILVLPCLFSSLEAIDSDFPDDRIDILLQRKTIIEEAAVPGGRPECSPPAIVPAADCGCFQFRFSILDRSEWQFLTQLCTAHLGGDLRLGRGSCDQAFRKSSGVFRFREFSTFMATTRERCAYEVPPPPLTIERPDDPGEAPPVPPMRPSPGISQAPIEETRIDKTIRVPYSRLHPVLRNLCVTLSWYRRVSRREALKRCCPRTVRRG